jgi:hypothetical protein
MIKIFLLVERHPTSTQGYLPEISSEMCNSFTGMPLACINDENQVIVHGIAGYPIGCAMKDTNVGLWDLIDLDSIADLRLALYKQKKASYHQIQKLKAMQKEWVLSIF